MTKSKPKSKTRRKEQESRAVHRRRHWTVTSCERGASLREVCFGRSWSWPVPSWRPDLFECLGASRFDVKKAGEDFVWPEADHSAHWAR